MAVLVVAKLTATSPALIEALRHRADARPTSFMLLMPATEPGLEGRRRQQPRLDEALAAWREAGLECDGVVGDDDAIVAVQEIWDPRRFDEIVVSTLPGHSSRWMRADLPHRIAACTDAQVTHVVAVTRAQEHPPASPPPPHEKPALGPLSVLAWGGRPPERPQRPKTAS